MLNAVLERLIGFAASGHGILTTFGAALVSCIEATLKQGLKRLNGGTVPTDPKLPEVPLLFLKGEAMSLLETKLLVCQLLAAQYPAELEESLAVAPEKVANIDKLTEDLRDRLDCTLASLMGGPDLNSQARIRCDYWRL